VILQQSVICALRDRLLLTISCVAAECGRHGMRPGTIPTPDPQIRRVGYRWIPLNLQILDYVRYRQNSSSNVFYVFFKIRNFFYFVAYVFSNYDRRYRPISDTRYRYRHNHRWTVRDDKQIGIGIAWHDGWGRVQLVRMKIVGLWKSNVRIRWKWG